MIKEWRKRLQTALEISSERLNSTFCKTNYGIILFNDCDFLRQPVIVPFSARGYARHDVSTLGMILPVAYLYQIYVKHMSFGELIFCANSLSSRPSALALYAQKLSAFSNFSFLYTHHMYNAAYRNCDTFSLSLGQKTSSNSIIMFSARRRHHGRWMRRNPKYIQRIRNVGVISDDRRDFYHHVIPSVQSPLRGGVCFVGNGTSIEQFRSE